MTEYEKHKAQKKAVIRNLTIMYINAHANCIIAPNNNNINKLKEIFNQIYIVNSKPIMPNNFKPSGYIAKLNKK